MVPMSASTLKNFNSWMKVVVRVKIVFFFLFFPFVLLSSPFHSELLSSIHSFLPPSLFFHFVFSPCYLLIYFLFHVISSLPPSLSPSLPPFQTTNALWEIYINWNRILTANLRSQWLIIWSFILIKQLDLDFLTLGIIHNNLNINWCLNLFKMSLSIPTHTTQ